MRIKTTSSEGEVMRVTLNIDEELIAEVVRLTGEKTKSKAVNKALAEVLNDPRSRLFLKAEDRGTRNHG
jgi:Arc/MetJ family transcription regulator